LGHDRDSETNVLHTATAAKWNVMNWKHVEIQENKTCGRRYELYHGRGWNVNGYASAVKRHEKTHKDTGQLSLSR
jgi:hypothetical protein